MKKLILLFALFFLLYCNAENHAKGQVHDSYSVTINSSSSIDYGVTHFAAFFENFMWNQEFQQSRVVFPSKMDKRTILEPGDWSHLFFYSESDYIPILSSDTLSLYDKDIATNEIGLSVIDFKRNVFERFNFKKANNHWFLINSESSSLKNLPDFEFIDFLTNFSIDTIFQINHIIFPISSSFADSENDYEIVTKTIQSEDWKHFNLIEYLNQLMVLSNIEIDNRYRNIFFRGVDNGIWIKYTFEKVYGNWKLIKLEDYST